MKRAVFVMLLAFSTALAAHASDGVDQDLTLIGSDDALIVIPDLQLPIDLDLSPLGSLLPDPGFMPPFMPPLGDWILPLSAQFPLELLEPLWPVILPR